MSSATILDRLNVDHAQPKTMTRSLHSTTSPTAVSFSTSGPLSPSLPSRPSMNLDSQRPPRSRRTTTSDLFSPSRIRRAASMRPSSKVKDTTTPKESIDSNGSMSPTSPTHQGASDRDFIFHYTSSASTPSIEKTRSSSMEGSSTGLKRSRTSILVAASDALGIRFGRRRTSIIKHPPPMPLILPDVIEICAPKKDEEAEEREQLREMAAQSIGLGSVLMHHDIHSRDNSIQEDDEEDEDLVMTPSPVDIPEPSNSRGLDTLLTDGTIGRSPHNSTVSVSQPVPLPARYRSGSMLKHSRTNSASLTAIPPYPTTPSALNHFKQQAATLPKYYPPSSLRIFALSKNWKTRYMILSTPTALITRGTGPAVSYLHLFKSANPDEKEIERLEINDDSVIFVAEEEVGGRRHVIKVAGLDVGAMKKDLVSEENGRTMWFLQITNSAEAQKWISSIKTAILGQRTMRAGLGPSLNISAGAEPRGDMDVMLSIRAQGLMSTANSPRSPTTATQQSNSQPDKTYASSISSHSVRSQVATSRPASNAVTTLKGLFSSPARPRASSRATSIDTERQQDPELKDDSFGRVSQNLFSILRPGTSPGASQTPSSSSLVSSTVPFAANDAMEHRERLDRKIVATEDNSNWTSFDPLLPIDSSAFRERPNRTLSLGAWSLHPPPRKRWTSASVTPITTIPSEEVQESQETEGSPQSGLYAHRNGNASTAGSFGVTVANSEEKDKEREVDTEVDTETELSDKFLIEPPTSPALSGFSFGSPEHKPRAGSLRSVSTFASGEQPGVSLDRSSSSTRRSSSMRRWSRQGGSIPQRTTPPSVPPPPPPANANGTRLQPHPPLSNDRPPSWTSTQSGTSQQSVVSSLPSFSTSKRASTSSSSMSMNGIGHRSGAVTPPLQSQVNLNHSPSRSTMSRTSIPPPPRPVPTFALPPTPSASAPASGAPTSVAVERPNSDISFAPSTKSSLRESVTQRALRLSMIAPKPPPSSILPPRPDESNTINSRPSIHRRSGSSDNSSMWTNNASTSSLHRTKLDSIPGSPNPPPLTISPFPPPSGPLPPPPPSLPPLSGATSSTPSLPRHNSFKHRLRILSAPSPVSTHLNNYANNTNHNITGTTQLSGIRTRPRGLTTTIVAPLTLTTSINPFSTSTKQPSYNKRNMTSIATTTMTIPATMTMTTTPSSFLPSPNSSSSPSTPIAERIIDFQDDPSFLQILTPTPTPPIIPLPPLTHGHGHTRSSSCSSSFPTISSSSPLSSSHRHRSPSPDILSGIPTSLSPPPRRNSKQVSFLDTDLDSPELPSPRQDEDKQTPESDHPFVMSLSRPGSVISLGIVSM